MSKKLFIGNLPFQVTDFDLTDLFKQYGDVVSAKVVVDRMTGRSKGFGFVEMNAEDSAKQAVEALNGTDLKGRPINVSYARSQEGGEYKSNSGNYGEQHKKRDFNKSTSDEW